MQVLAAALDALSFLVLLPRNHTKKCIHDHAAHNPDQLVQGEVSGQWRLPNDSADMPTDKPAPTIILMP